MADKNKIILNFRRFEFKYLLPLTTADRLVPELLDYMIWDPYTKDNGAYDVFSLYYDSPSFKNYYEKLAGILYRSKQRVRFYEPVLSNNKYIFLEIKNKVGDIIIKERTGLSFKQFIKFLKDPLGSLSLNTLNDEALRSFVTDMFKLNLNPVVLISYKRKALYDKSNPNFRVTFDYNIKATYPDLKEDLSNLAYKDVWPDIVVLEVKYNGLMPYWFYNLINKYKLVRGGFSKYCQSIPKCYNMVDVDEIIY